MKVLVIIEHDNETVKQSSYSTITAAKEISDSVEAIVLGQGLDSVINELIQPLNAEQKDIMNNLLESVQTGQLRKQFEKYVPAVINGRSPAKKQALKEGTEVTGNRTETNVSSKANDEKVVDIRRLAGL